MARGVVGRGTRRSRGEMAVTWWERGGDNSGRGRSDDRGRWRRRWVGKKLGLRVK